MDLTLGILTVWVLASAGVQLGTLWIMKLSILPMLNNMTYDRYVNACQLIDMHVFHPIAVWNGIISAGIGVWAAFLATSGAASALFIVGSIAMVVVGIVSEVFNRPIWRQIEHWSPERHAKDWVQKRFNWHIAHQVRTYGAIVAVGAYVAAFVAGIA
ncbi:hypothetical protein [Amycolatopsis nigrescens]|uniref:hypothetical protein n=1 Tax=Amycolatopsis nigrescens TaxID=381445 RepID=UPI00036C338F|nr:hypothetical protein [Amycolatopsis nigrescens]